MAKSAATAVATPPASDAKDAKAKRARIDPTEFVTAWERANSAQEVADHFKLPKSTVAAKASAYRKRGICMKPMVSERNGKLDVDKLNVAIAKAGNLKLEKVKARLADVK